MAAPEFATLIESPEHSATILSIRRMASEHGYNLLKLMNEKASADGKTFLQIATSESLTCGTIMTLLTEIPWGGYMKYGCFGVYDTDAKRVFNHVTTDDVYTHKCASEMAIGVLKNSNATIAIAVTGNSMPLNEHVEMMGEVFISVAGYNEMGEIIFVTNSINACNDSGIGEMQSLCGKWYKTIATDKRYNKRVKVTHLGNPAINVAIGSKYLRLLISRFDGNLIFALASYNAGENRIDHWRKEIFRNEDPLSTIESIPFEETRNYVKLIYRNNFFYSLLSNKSVLMIPLEDTFKVSLGAKNFYLNIKAKMHNVSVLNDVFFSFNSKLSSFFDFSF